MAHSASILPSTNVYVETQTKEKNTYVDIVQRARWISLFKIRDGLILEARCCTKLTGSPMILDQGWVAMSAAMLMDGGAERFRPHMYAPGHSAHTINDQLNGEIGVYERVDGTKPIGSHTELTGSPTYGDGN